MTRRRALEFVQVVARAEDFNDWAKRLGLETRAQTEQSYYIVLFEVLEELLERISLLEKATQMDKPIQRGNHGD